MGVGPTQNKVALCMHARRARACARPTKPRTHPIRLCEASIEQARVEMGAGWVVDPLKTRSCLCMHARQAVPWHVAAQRNDRRTSVDSAKPQATSRDWRDCWFAAAGAVEGVSGAQAPGQV